MIRLLTLASCFFAARPAAAGMPYDMATDAMAGIPEAKEFEALAALPVGPALLSDKRAAALLAANQIAIEAFRETAKMGSDGYFLGQKPEKPGAKAAPPEYDKLTRLLDLTILDAKMRTARKQPREAEQDLLAVAGLLVQLAQQKFGIRAASLTLQTALEKAYTPLASSIRGASAGTGYLKELSGQLARAAGEQDFLKAAFLEEAEAKKAGLRENLNARTAEEERKKLSLAKSLAAKAIRNDDYYPEVYARFDAAADAEAGAYSAAARENAPKIIEEFFTRRREEIAARERVRDGRGWLAALKDGVKGAQETKRLLAEEKADALTARTGPDHAKLIERYHVFFNQFAVLRTGLALKIYQRERKQLPKSLDKLVPAYLSEVPKDSLDKFQPLRYKKDGSRFKVYGLGPDQKDSRGALIFDWVKYSANTADNAGDIVFSE